MKEKVRPDLISDIRKFGKFDVSGCFNCGSCTAICSLSGNSSPAPRRSMRYAILGLKKALRGGLEPWLCYYCGDCSTTCPRGAEPGESMMTLRRYLTALYDWTGLSRKFYLSAIWEIGSLVLVGGIVLALILTFHGPLVTDRVELNTFAPVRLVHIFDIILLFTLSFFIISNVFRMFWFTMVRGNDTKIPLWLYITEIKTLILHAATQLRFSECKSKFRWIKHLLLVSGYALMFTLVVVFLFWFQTDNIYPLYHPQRWLGYYATAAIIYASVDILIGRLKKLEQIHKFSELSDWLFPVLLILTAVTGIAAHAFRYLGLPLATYYTYTLHLMIAVPMLVIEVPFGKWAHLAYRPLAMYFQTVKEKALEYRSS